MLTPLLSPTLWAGDKTDSLLSVIRGTETDSNKAVAYMLLGVEYATKDTDSSSQFYETAAQLCAKNDWFLLHGKVLTNQAFDAYYGLNSDTCLALIDSAIVKYKKSSDNDNNLLIAYYNKGVFIGTYGKIEDAIESYQLALSFKEQANNPTYASYILNNLGFLYRQIGAYDKAIESIIETIKIKEELNEPTLGFSYTILAKNYESINEPLLANDQYNLALDLYKTQQDSGRVAVCYRNIAQNLLKLNEKDSAAIYLQKSFNLFRTLGYKDQLALTYLANSELEEVKGDREKQQKAIDSAEIILPKEGFESILASILCKRVNLTLASKLSVLTLTRAKKDAHKARSIWESSQNLENLVVVNSALSRIHENLGNKDSALHFSRVHISLKDSLLEVEKLTTVRRLNVEFQTEKRLAQIAVLNEENKLKEESLKASAKLESAQKIVIWVLTSGLIILGVLLYIISRILNSNKQAHKRLTEKSAIIEKQNTEREYLLKEIHHRVKNNLQIISSLLDMQLKGLEDQKLRDTLIESRSRVASMGLIHQLLYEGNSQASVYLKPYIEQLTTYIAQSFGKANEVSIEVNVSEELTINIETAIPFGLIVTELITNAYKYAFVESENGRICIGVVQTKESYKLTFSDNGVGLPQELDIKKTKSLGLRLVKNLTQQLKGSLTYLTDEGATFSIEFFEKELN